MDLAFIIVFGTRWHFRRARGGWRGVLNCPACASPQLFQEMEAFKAFTLYWKPLWTLERGGRLVACQHCRGRFDVPPELELELPVEQASSRPAPIG